MALLNRKKTASTLPEVDQYYESQRRDRAWLAWVLAFVSIAVVASAVILLFLGGRWIYRQATKDDEPTIPVAVNSDNGNVPSFDGETEESEGSGEDTSQGQEENGGESEGTVDAPARTETPSTPMPTTGDTNLPNTGPANLLGAFAATSTLAGGIHYVANRRRSKP